VAKNENIEKAHKLFTSGFMLKEISDRLKVPEGTVRSWKNRYKWSVAESATLQKKIRKQTKRCVANVKKKANDGTKETLQNKELTDEQQMFCIYYSKSFNATQSYVKAYGCTYESAMCNGSRLLGNERVRTEIMRLKEEKRKQIVAGAEDIIEKQMRIAFSDIGDYLKFGRETVPVMGPFGPVIIKDEETGNKTSVTKEINVVRFNESCNVDTSIIQEVKQGKDGTSLKLADSQKAMEWLGKYFMMNPLDTHKIEFDEKKLEIELLKAEISAKEITTEEEPQEDDNFIKALNTTAKEVWDDEQQN